MKPSDYSDDDVRCAINSIKHDHDPEAARNLIEYFHACLDRHLPFSDRLFKEYILHTFGLIVQGKRTDIAFGLARRQGRPLGKGSSQDVIIAAFVFRRIRELNTDRGKGKNWHEAIGEAENKFLKGRKTIEAAYGKYLHIFEEIPEDELDVMLSAILED